jgi:hypothetical protein
METSISGLGQTIQKDATVIAREILNLEKKYWTAMKDHDLQMALSLTDFPCIVAGAHGISSVSQPQFIEMFNSQNDTLRIFNFDEDKTEIRQISPDTIVIAYQVHTSVNQDGHNKIINAVDTSTWIKRGDKWLCAMHTETELLKKH